VTGDDIVKSNAVAKRGRPPTWADYRALEHAERNRPAALRELALRLADIGTRNGLSAVGITTAEPLDSALVAINERVAAGHHADMVFTFSRPEKATTPARLIPEAASLVVGAWPYYFASPVDPSRRDSAVVSSVGPLDSGADSGADPNRYLGDVARYQWVDHYGALRGALRHLAVELKANGWRARVLADDNALVDRAAAHRAGIGWFGKNANLLLPGHGSWFVLGAVVTNAPLPTSPAPLADGCGTCTRCIPACPTGAIVAPGVIDGRRCLAWLVQAPGDIPEEYRVAMGARIYGCDDCQDACPENRIAIRRTGAQPAPPDAVAVVDLVKIIESTDEQLLAQFGRWWLPNRNPDILRRNAAVALGNTGNPEDQSLRRLLSQLVQGGPPEVSQSLRRHTNWAIIRLNERSRELRMRDQHAELA
jgi:epoxyqueuosine reductase